ncbi:MAG: CZB domain-containing protein [bacterium]|nr:CZB domain-containing protein [bacterium]
MLPKQLREAIDKTLIGHGDWKLRLREAIEKGTSEYTVEVLAKDSVCEFGKWLYSLPPAVDTTDCKNVKTLHALFHTKAAEVLSMALGSQKQEALKSMDRGGFYYQASANLVRALQNWKGKIAGE